MTLEIVVTALLQASLGHPLLIQEPHHIGEQITLGIHPVGIGLQINTTDSRPSHSSGCFRIQPLQKFDAGGAVADPLELAAPAVHGRAQISDGTNKLSLVLGNGKANAAYQEAVAMREARLKTFCSNNKIRLEYVMTNDEPLLGIERLLR